jgi:hypothetical protein
MIVAGIAVICTPKIPSANGRSPGVRSDDVAVDAVCKDKSGKINSLSSIEIKVVDSQQKTLETRNGEAIIKFPLAKMKMVSFQNNTVNNDGYTKAEIIFIDGSKETYEVKVKEKGKLLKVVGRVKGGIIEIELLKCKYVEFSTKAQDSSESGTPYPVEKR